ncbi:MAG: glycosyltransferase family 4 protein [Candidatus Kerfeldbacteria bacterium]|nr:glycosyltransferase family 4 protein [Candidatus Kerfeldbacteria bacterium]
MKKSLRIGIDMAATAGQKSGLGFYVEHIVSALHALPGNHELVELHRVKKNLRTPQRILWDQIGVPLSFLNKKIDVLFTPAFSAPRFPKPVVMTAHDIFGIIHPDRFSGAAAYYWTKLLPRSFKRAEQLICVSEYTKKTIVDYLHIDESKLQVVPLAAGKEFRVLDDVEGIKKSLHEMKITTPFILSVGTLEPRKNFARLIEAFAFTKRGETKLVIVGKKGWEYAEIFETIRKYHMQETVIILDYITQEQLVALYNACLFFIMPSLFEGFGLPALEAMNCGAPVAVAQNTSLPEVTGEAGVLFDPYDVQSIRARLDLLLQNNQLRQEMQQKSFRHAQQFSWEQTATATLSIIERVVG